MQGGEILSVYTMGTCLAFFYTAPPLRLKYFALGDIAIFLAFGPLLCYCSLLLVSDRVAHTMWVQVFASTIPCACICECILHANNSRDIGEDSKAGLITLATLLGFEQSRRLYIALISIAYLTVIVSGVVQAKWSLLLVLVSSSFGRCALLSFGRRAWLSWCARLAFSFSPGIRRRIQKKNI